MRIFLKSQGSPTKIGQCRHMHFHGDNGQVVQCELLFTREPDMAACRMAVMRGMAVCSDGTKRYQSSAEMPPYLAHSTDIDAGIAAARIESVRIVVFINSRLRAGTACVT
jgi:hypothetical protein